MPDSTVWVMRWEHPGQVQTAGREDIVAILPGSTSIDDVATFAELLNRSRAYTLSEKLAIADGSWADPYPASVDRDRQTITCGHSPFIMAYKIERPRIVGSQSEETLVED